jgi:hypothetical protein
MMNQTPPNSVAVAEPRPTSELLGLLGAVKDEHFNSFKWNGLWFYREGNWLTASLGEPHEAVGGRLHLGSASLKEASNWVQAKTDYYDVR